MGFLKLSVSDRKLSVSSAVFWRNHTSDLEVRDDFICVSTLFALVKQLYGSGFILSLIIVRAAWEISMNVCGFIYMQQYAFEYLHLNAKIQTTQSDLDICNYGTSWPY